MCGTTFLPEPKRTTQVSAKRVIRNGYIEEVVVHRLFVHVLWNQRPVDELKGAGAIEIFPSEALSFCVTVHKPTDRIHEVFRCGVSPIRGKREDDTPTRISISVDSSKLHSGDLQ